MPAYEFDLSKYPLKGVNYNVVRRPFSGGRGSIKQREASKNKPAETADEYWERFRQYFVEDPGYWFFRFTAEVSPKDVENFERRCLRPVLEEMCAWYDFVTGGDPFGERANYGIHYQFPMGVWSPLTEGGATDYDSYLETGNEVGLRRVDKLFEELQ